MSVIVKIDNDYEMLDSSKLLRGSIESLGETVNIDFYGVTRTAIFCEGGIPKKLTKELPKWRSGEKTLDNQKKKEMKKTVLLSNGKSVEIVQRPKRERADKSPTKTATPAKKAKTAKKAPVSVGTAAATDIGTDKAASQDTAHPAINKPSGKRRQRSPTPQILDSEEEEEGDTAAPTTAAQLTGGGDLAAILAAVQSVEAKMNGGMRTIHQHLEVMNGRIKRLEDQQDEIADSLEAQRTMVREVASATPQIAENAQKAACGTDSIKEMLPAPPQAFLYRYIDEARVRELDDQNDDFLSFAESLNQELFSPSERLKTLAHRDKSKVKWMTQCLMHRRRFSVGGGEKYWVAQMRKRLNSYASRDRKHAKTADGVGHGIPEEVEEGEAGEEGQEGEEPTRDRNEMGGVEGENDDRGRGGLDGVYGYLGDDNWSM